MSKILILGSNKSAKNTIYISTTSADIVDLSNVEEFNKKIPDADAIMVAIDLSTRTEPFLQSPKKTTVSDDELDIIQVVEPRSFENMSNTEKHLRKEVDNYIRQIKSLGKKNVPIVLVGTNFDLDEAEHLFAIVNNISQEYDVPFVIKNVNEDYEINSALKKSEQNIFNLKESKKEVGLQKGGYHNTTQSTIYYSTHITKLNPMTNMREQPARALIVDLLEPVDTMGPISGESSFGNSSYLLQFDPATEICFKCRDSKDYPGSINPYFVFKEIYRAEIGKRPTIHEEHIRKTDTKNRYIIIEKSRYKKLLIDYLVYENRLETNDPNIRNKRQDYIHQSIAELQLMVNERKNDFIDINSNELKRLQDRCSFSYLAVQDGKRDLNGKLLEKNIVIRLENGAYPEIMQMLQHHGCVPHAVTPYEMTFKLNCDSFNEIMYLLKMGSIQQELFQASLAHARTMKSNLEKSNIIADFLGGSCAIEYQYHKPVIVGTKEQPVLKVKFHVQKEHTEDFINIILYDNKLHWAFQNKLEIRQESIHSMHKPSLDKDNNLEIEMTQAEFNEIYDQLVYIKTRTEKEAAMCSEMSAWLNTGTCTLKRIPDDPKKEIDDKEPRPKINLTIKFTAISEGGASYAKELLSILLVDKKTRPEYQNALENYLQYLIKNKDSMSATSSNPAQLNALTLLLNDAEFHELHQKMGTLNKSYQKTSNFFGVSPMPAKATTLPDQSAKSQKHDQNLANSWLYESSNENLSDLGIEQILFSNEVNENLHDVNIYFISGVPSRLMELLNENNMRTKVVTESSMMLNLTPNQCRSLMELIHKNKNDIKKSYDSEKSGNNKQRELKELVIHHLSNMSGCQCDIVKIIPNKTNNDQIEINDRTFQIFIQYPLGTTSEPPAELNSIIGNWASVNSVPVEKIEPTKGQTLISNLPQKMKGAMDSVKSTIQTGSISSPNRPTNKMQTVVVDKVNGIITLQVNQADLKHINALCIVANENKTTSKTGTTVLTSGAHSPSTRQNSPRAADISPPASPPKPKFEFFRNPKK